MADESENRIPASNVAELAGFFSAHSRWLFGHACARTNGNRELPADLVQDTFEAAALTWDMLRRHPDRRQQAWLLSTLAHKNISDFRHQEVFRRSQPDNVPTYQPSEACTKAEALNAIALARAREIIEDMPPRQREIALLRWQDHLPVADIGVLLSVAEGTVHAQLHSARRKLVAGLERYCPSAQETPAMTSGAEPLYGHGALFVADFYPKFGAYLAQQLAGGYDAAAARTIFRTWLAVRADDGGALAAYVASVERIPQLAAGEETELATRVLAGYRAEERLAEGDDGLADEAREDLEQAAEDGIRAGNRLLEANLRTVVAIAQQFAAQGVPFQDLIEKGAGGLVSALRSYDPAKGYPFTLYSTWWIRQAVTRTVAARRPVVLSPGPGTGEDGLTLTERRVSQALGREPTAEELAAEVDLPPS